MSPPGAGLDCYRTYETLSLGSIPIVLSSQLDVIFNDLPVLIVQQWSEVTPELLETTYRRIVKGERINGGVGTRTGSWSLEKMYNSYWEQLIYRERKAMGGKAERMRYGFLT